MSEIIESKRLELRAPFSRRIAQSLDADAAGQATFHGGLARWRDARGAQKNFSGRTWLRGPQSRRQIVRACRHQGGQFDVCDISQSTVKPLLIRPNVDHQSETCWKESNKSLRSQLRNFKFDTSGP